MFLKIDVASKNQKDIKLYLFLCYTENGEVDMAISKTDFINYTRCPRYGALEEVKKEKLDADVSYDEYKEKEKIDNLTELINVMYEINDEGEEENLIDVKNAQLEAMMKYYKMVEELAAKVTKKYFKGRIVSSLDTFKQERFDYSLNGIKYFCYIDIYNEADKAINIIEVKATTSKKFADLGKKEHSIFYKKDNIYYLKDEIGYDYTEEMTDKEYNNYKSKLYDRFKEGKYIFDLAIQRYFIEGEYRNSKNEAKLKGIKYYLAVLNHEYVYNGNKEYDVDDEGNDIVTFIDLTKVTADLQKVVDTNRILLEGYLKDNRIANHPLGVYCEYKKQTECKYFKSVCGCKIPKTNSSLNYLNNQSGFKDPNGNTYKGIDLINEGYLNLLDIPLSWIKNPNHFIQREALENNKPYINKEKLQNALNLLKYPIYHLDFETFPCPIPRFTGEKCYEQSPFEFSLHIESAPGACNKDNDNYVFMAHSFNDEREELVKKLCELIPGDKGTLFAQNVSFEKRVIKRLGDIYPEYKKQLLNIYDRGFDLIDILKTNSRIYEELGYSSEEARIVNYYDERFSGSYSIKKTLPVFSNLSYNNLNVKNGVEAICEYASFANISKEERELKRKALIEYCKQDTWAMVVILDSLRNSVK